MEKELFSQFDYSETGDASGIRTDSAEDVRAQEKALKRDSMSFWVVGLLSLVAGGAAFAIFNVPGMLAALEPIVPWLVGAGIGGLGVGLFKLIKKLRKDGLKFPSLKLRRKGVSSGFGSRSSSAEKPFEETTYLKKKLTKSDDNRVFFGVAGGLSEFSGIPVNLLRLIFVIATIASGGAVIPVYLAMALIMPAVKRFANAGKK